MQICTIAPTLPEEKNTSSRVLTILISVDIRLFNTYIPQWSILQI